MTDSASTRDLIDRLVQQSGIKKKLATEVFRVIPEIIEVGLKKDGEARVKGLGTFRMKWTKGRIGRNPKTGQVVKIPPHNRLVFLPEQSLKEYVNRDFRLLSYKVIPGTEARAEEENFIPEFEPVIEPEPEIQIAVEPEPEPEIQIAVEPEPEPPIRKRRVHWIVPVAIGVIAVLCVVFYFRNFNPIEKKTKDRIQEAYVVTRQPADTVQSSKFKVQSEDSLPSNPNPVTPIPQPATQNSQSETPTQNPALRTQNSEGKHLFQLSREVYGNPFLWVLIYKENLDKVPNPDVVISGKELVIPELEGKTGNLSHNDSINVAEGYRLVYEFYKAKGDSKADDFRRAMGKYQPK